MLLHPVCGRGWSCVLWPTGLCGRDACVLRETHQLCPLRSSLCFSASRSHQGRWRLSLASGSGASVVAFIPAVVFTAAAVAFMESATATASGAAAALDAATKSDSMPLSRRTLPRGGGRGRSLAHAVCCLFGANYLVCLRYLFCCPLAGERPQRHSFCWEMPCSSTHVHGGEKQRANFARLGCSTPPRASGAAEVGGPPTRWGRAR